MLTHPTIEKLQMLKLSGMLKSYQQQQDLHDVDALTFEDRLGLLVDQEITERENRRLTLRLRSARLRQSACMEDIDYRNNRGLDKSFLRSLNSCQWIKEHNNILVTGPTGSGKSFLACALAHKACQNGFTALYLRAPLLSHDLSIARADGSYKRRLAKIAKLNLLVIDDFGLVPLPDEHLRDLLEVIDDRYKVNSTIIASQLPVDTWHQAMLNPTLADAILDRVVHISYKVQLQGDSMRKRHKPKNDDDSNTQK